MEKKTIGAFIAALRKANGLTQRELAEKLNVSDKAVSRWERDEALPDLSLIPVLAEIFNVTCDELLKGQRIDPEAQIPEKAAVQKEKQIRNLLNSAKNKISDQQYHFSRSWFYGASYCIIDQFWLSQVLYRFLGRLRVFCKRDPLPDRFPDTG